MSCYRKETNMLYGGDYNPEQWPEEVWQEDMRLMAQAHINIVTLNVFSWAALQPDEDTYQFEKLDAIMELVRANGLDGKAAPGYFAHGPAWKEAQIRRTAQLLPEQPDVPAVCAEAGRNAGTAVPEL